MSFGLRSAAVSFGDVSALDDVSLEVAPGDVVAVVGGDGAGKTTLLRVLVGEQPLTSGSVSAPPVAATGYLPATAGSWPSLTVRENLDFVGGAYGIPSSELRSRRNEMVERIGLRGAEDRLASQLSGGMRRKLGFAMAALHRPALLVLDEPSTGVDPVSRIDLWRLISEAAAGGAAVVLSTTYLDEAERASRLLALDAGRTLAEGSVADVMATLHGTITETVAPSRRAWAWRRGRRFHEFWPQGSAVEPGAEQVRPDLEDAVLALAVERRGGAA